MKVRLGDYIKEYSERNKQNSNIPVYSVTNSQGFVSEYFSKEVASKDKTTYKLVPRGYFAYNPSRINVGSVDFQRKEDCVIVSPLYVVFHVSDELDKNYLLYYLKSQPTLCQIKHVATGSVRDNLKFSYLADFNIELKPIEEQKTIAKTLQHIETLIVLYKKQLAKLDELVKCRFVEMFGDIEVNPRRLPILSWNQVFHTTTGKLDANAMEQDGIYPFFTCAKESYRINSYAFDCEALLLAGNNAAGVYDVKHYKGKFNAYQRTYVLKLRNENWSYLLFKLQLENKLTYMQSQSKGTNTRYLTMGILNEINFIIPSVEEQQIFADFVHHIDKLRFISGRKRVLRPSCTNELALTP